MLLKLKGGTTTSRKSFSKTLKGTASDYCTVVKELVPRVVLEIRDLDSCTSEQEVEQALKRDLQDYNSFLRFFVIQPNAKEQRMAIAVTVEASATNKLMATT